MHPRVIIQVTSRLRWFQLFVTSQNWNFNFFLKKKNQINRSPWCRTREHLSIDVSITNVGLILTKLRWFQLVVTSQNSKKKNSKKIELIGLHGVVLVKTFPLMYQLYWCRTDIDEAKVISALRQKSKFEFRTFLKKKIKFLGFHGVVLVKTFPLMYQLY